MKNDQKKNRTKSLDKKKTKRSKIELSMFYCFFYFLEEFCGKGLPTETYSKQCYKALR